MEITSRPIKTSSLSTIITAGRCVASQFFLVSPERFRGTVLSCTFIFGNERNWTKKSARVSEKLVSPGLPGLQVATRLGGATCLKKSVNFCIFKRTCLRGFFVLRCDNFRLHVYMFI